MRGGEKQETKKEKRKKRKKKKPGSRIEPTSFKTSDKELSKDWLLVCNSLTFSFRFETMSVY